MNTSNKHMTEQPDNENWSLNQIYFYLTEGCNLACRHCWLAPGFDVDGSAYPTLPVELFKVAIKEAKPLGLSGVKLTGGEPLLHPQFTQILEIVRQAELRLTIETNGVLCTPAMAKEIAKAPNRFVSVSIDGADAATHEWVRGVPGCFEKACQGVRNLAAADTAPQVIMSIMRCNADQVEALVRMAEELGASSVKFNIVQPTARGEQLHKTDENLGIEELVKLGRHVEVDLAPGTQIQLFFDYPLAFRPLSRLASGDGCDTCGILSILGVIPTGQYALCGIGEHVPELIFGTVGEDRLEAIWQENKILRDLREGMPARLTGVCARCLMRHLCLGSCIAQNYYKEGSLWAPFWFCEQAAEAGLFPESRLVKVMPEGNAKENVREF
jgi:SynChlorMet cassette radical SAM/SPASM protein ScmF